MLTLQKKKMHETAVTSRHFLIKLLLVNCSYYDDNMPVGETVALDMSVLTRFSCFDLAGHR